MPADYPLRALREIEVPKSRDPSLPVPWCELPWLRRAADSRCRAVEHFHARGVRERFVKPLGSPHVSKLSIFRASASAGSCLAPESGPADIRVVLECGPLARPVRLAEEAV